MKRGAQDDNIDYGLLSYSKQRTDRVETEKYSLQLS